MPRRVSELYVRCSSASQSNSARWDAEFSAIAAINRTGQNIVGVRCNIALSGALSNTTTGTLTYWTDLVDRCVAAGLKLSMGIGGEGPQKALAAWKALNGNTEWTYNRRPVPGTANGVWLAMVAIKQACIDYAYTAYTAAGYTFRDYVSIELDNEPGLGGSGASGVPTDGSFGDITDEGWWDSSLEVFADDLVASFKERLNFEVPRLNFRGATVISPSFECQSSTTFTLELATHDNNYEDDWIDYVDKWALNLYYSAPEYAGLPGPREYARVWAYGQNGLSNDTACAAYKIQQLMTATGCALEDVLITEVGISSTKLGMDSGDPENHFERGRVIVALLNEAGNLGVGRVTFYTVTDTSSASADDRYGWLNTSLDTYSSFAPMLRYAGQEISASDMAVSGSWVYASGEPDIP